MLARFSRTRCFRPKLRLFPLKLRRFPPQLQRWNNPTLRRVFYIMSRHSTHYEPCAILNVSYVGAGEELQTRGSICGREGEFVDVGRNYGCEGEFLDAGEE